MLNRVDTLTPGQREQIAVYERRWTQMALRTGGADRTAFEQAARRCYEFAGLAWHGNVVWVSSPLVLALAAPLASLLLATRGEHGVIRDIDGITLGRTLDAALGREVRRAVRAVLRSAPSGRVSGDGVTGGFVAGVIRDALNIAVLNAMRMAMDETVHDALRFPGGLELCRALLTVVRDRVAKVAEEAGDPSAGQAIRDGWMLHLSGALAAANGHWGGTRTAYVREVCRLALTADLRERAIAYEQTLQSAGAWQPHRGFLMVCERPEQLHVETRGRSLRLHCVTGPAIAWADGWRVYSAHGREVPAWIIEHPERITVQTIEDEINAEVRRVMLERYGWARYIADGGAEVVESVPSDHPIAGLRGARLLRKRLPGDSEPIVFLDMVNSTPEPDGSHRHYLQRIDPDAYDGDAGRLCHAAMASQWHYRDEAGVLRRTFERWQDYVPGPES